MLIKATNPLERCQLKFDNESNGFFSGYCSVFDSSDNVGDTIMRGAYEKTLQKSMPLLYINHDHRQGALPSGKWVEMKEDDYGLYGQGQLFMDTEKGRHAYVAMKEGVLTGLSIGYIVEKFNKKDDGGRYLEEITLKEVSPVVAPCEEKARITDVKHIIDELMSMKDLEHFLRESGGFSKSVATAFVGQIVRVSRGEHVEQKNQITEQLGAQALSVISSLKNKL